MCVCVCCTGVLSERFSLLKFKVANSQKELQTWWDETDFFNTHSMDKRPLRAHSADIQVVLTYILSINTKTSQYMHPPARCSTHKQDQWPSAAELILSDYLNCPPATVLPPSCSATTIGPYQSSKSRLLQTCSIPTVFSMGLTLHGCWWGFPTLASLFQGLWAEKFGNPCNNWGPLTGGATL